MRTTLNIDDDLYAQAVELTGVHEKNRVGARRVACLD